MTVPATDAKGGPYTGDGIQTDYTFDFKIFESSDVTVTIDDSLSVSVVDPSDYTVDFDDTGVVIGGTVELDDPLGDGYELTITRNVEFDQLTALEVGEILYPPTLERAYDNIVFQTQYLNQAFLDLVIAVNAMFITAGAGNVVGGSVPSTVNNITTYSDQSGLLIKDSGISITQITTNQNNIADNTSDIATNTSDISDNSDSITAITRAPNGLISNSDADTDHDINIASGYIYDSLYTTPILLSSEITKQIDANWVAGDDAGGFPSGLTLAADTWYNVFVIYNLTGQITDAGFDTSLTAANLLADAVGYTKYKLVGIILTDASKNISVVEPVVGEEQEAFIRKISAYGIVTTAGARLSGSVNWTVSRNAAGTYQLNITDSGDYMVQVSLALSASTADSMEITAFHSATTGIFANNTSGNVMDESSTGTDMQWAFSAIKL